jgi:hypothetical protein
VDKEEGECIGRNECMFLFYKLFVCLLFFYLLEILPYVDWLRKEITIVSGITE